MYKIDELHLKIQFIMDELEKMAAMYNMEVEKIKSSLRETDIEDIKGQIKIRKTLDLLVENATIA